MIRFAVMPSGPATIARTLAIAVTMAAAVILGAFSFDAGMTWAVVLCLLMQGLCLMMLVLESRVTRLEHALSRLEPPVQPHTSAVH